MSGRRPTRLLFLVTEDWYFCSHRLPLARVARQRGFDVTVVTRIGAHGGTLADAGLRVVPFDFARGSVNPLREARTIAGLIRVYRRERPDVVHHVAMKPVLYGSIAATLAGRPRVINAVAGLGWISSQHAGKAAGRRALVRRALGSLLRSGTTIVQNPDDERFLVEAGVPASRISRIAGAGVDLDHFAPAPEPAGIPCVVLAARLLRDKGVADFVAAARLLRGRGVRARFVLAGSPDHANPSSISEGEIVDWVESGVVEHLGRVRDMAPVLAASHIACLPSYYGEGIPKTLIEAAAAGRPVVTTDMPGCREVVTDGDNGLLVPPRDPASLADALDKLIGDAALRRRMGAAGRSRAVASFGLAQVTEQTLALYGDPGT